MGNAEKIKPRVSAFCVFLLLKCFTSFVFVWAKNAFPAAKEIIGRPGESGRFIPTLANHRGSRLRHQTETNR
jgi:hypothetical protein